MFKSIVSLLIIITISSLTLNELNAAPAIGDNAPAFKLQNQDGKWKSLTDFKGQWLVAYFYPRDNTPGCTIEAGKFRDNKEAFTNLNASVVGISLDDVESHLNFSKTLNLNFSLLADVDKQTSKSYEVLTDLGLVAYSQRQTFIIDPEGRIAFHFEEVSPETHAAVVLKKLVELIDIYK